MGLNQRCSTTSSMQLQTKLTRWGSHTDPHQYCGIPSLQQKSFRPDSETGYHFSLIETRMRLITITNLSLSDIGFGR